ncbi:hypothetical protein D0Z07_8617 [Hyphodiscus hymeniophilus]|uniref:F-box domain-containing protein n=1 Tax=Hyphodiscus hymeniophilus TaxID=353542 RepID=A0A9P6SL70_9HELO|nr:hypothetical protein D0Z07_8617 [Hyphodiscus hymeniophilus]
MGSALGELRELDQTIQTFHEQAGESADSVDPVLSADLGNGQRRTQSTFETIPEEILEIILKYLVQDPAKLSPFQDRASLSFESFASALPHVPEDANNILTFRLLCKKFADRGRCLVYARVKIRSTTLGFAKIRSLTMQPEIAAEVQKVSYMVHDLYPENQDLWQQLLLDARSSTAASQIRFDETRDSRNNHRVLLTPAFRRLEGDLRRCRRDEALVIQGIARAREQMQIKLGNEDQKTLTDALSAFKNLEQIRLMRNTDKLDRDLEAYLKTANLHGVNAHSILRRQYMSSRWTAACERATMVLGRAYSESKSTANRLSSRFMDPPPHWLQQHIPNEDISNLAARLTCLELQIDDPSDLEGKMNQLSTVFRTLFQAAQNIEGLHIGLCRRISISLETIFDNVKWTNLQYIGFSRWNLDSDEIISFLRRHETSLKSVRFREVKLKQGSWIEIAKFLRRNVKLNWASFRQVGYEPQIGGGLVYGTAPGGGFALLRGPPPESYEEYSSESSDDIGEHVTSAGFDRAIDLDETSSSEDGQSDAEITHSNEPAEATELGINSTAQSVGEDTFTTALLNEGQDEVYDDWDESPSGSVAGDSEVGVVNSLALDDKTMVEHSSASNDAVPACHCHSGFAWGDFQDDHGLDPTKAQWKNWERWVIKPCLKHDPVAD